LSIIKILLITKTSINRPLGLISRISLNRAVKWKWELFFVDDGPDVLALEGLGDVPFFEAVDD